MVCIPCIVIPVLLWVYKRFLEPFLYPFISPIINKFWPKKVDHKNGAGDINASEITNPNCKPVSNGDTAASGSATIADKKTD